MLARQLTRLLLACACAVGVQAQPVTDRQALTLDGAQSVMAAAHAEASANGWDVVIVIVDAGGHVVAVLRMDGALLPSLDVAQGKARTAALYRRPTPAFADRLASGDAAVHALPDVMPVEGGLPILVDGEVIGAVGVSGIQAVQDAQIAQAGIDALLRLLGD